MKSEKICAMFRKAKHVYIYNKMHPEYEKPVQQYITDGSACYPLENLPLFDEENIWGYLGADINTMVANKATVETAPMWFMKAIESYSDGDIPIMPFKYDFYGYKVLHTQHAHEDDGREDVVVFINPKYLEPISNEPYELWYRKVENMQMVVATVGMLVKAIIAPIKISKDKAKNKLEYIEALYEYLLPISTAGDNEADSGQLTL